MGWVRSFIRVLIRRPPASAVLLSEWIIRLLSEIWSRRAHSSPAACVRSLVRLGSLSPSLTPSDERTNEPPSQPIRRSLLSEVLSSFLASKNFASPATFMNLPFPSSKPREEVNIRQFVRISASPAWRFIQCLFPLHRLFRGIFRADFLNFVRAAPEFVASAFIGSQSESCSNFAALFPLRSPSALIPLHWR